jgi:protein transport protein HofQ
VPRHALLAGVLGLAALVTPLAACAQAAQSQARRISVSWTEAPIADVLQAFAAFAGASIVAGSGVGGFVTAEIHDQPWDVALQAILSTRGLVAAEDDYGIIRVESMVDLDARETVEPVLTRSYRIAFAEAAEIQSVVASLLSPRGSASVVQSTNTLVVSDIERVQRAVRALLR